jgi:anaerobic magnesium-protoporphyrin IX monomethyl ester cyclase
MIVNWPYEGRRFPGGVRFLIISFVASTAWHENEQHGYTIRMGPAYISSHLKQNGHHVDIHYCPYTNDEQSLTRHIAKVIDECRPDIIGFSITTDNFWLLKISTSFIEKHYEIPVIVGGPHAIIDPDSILDLDGIFGVCLGEGEIPMVNLANRIADGKSIIGVEGFQFKGQQHKGIRYMTQDINELLYPDRESYIKKYSGNVRNGWIFQSHRGCPYRCAFCSEKFFNRAFGASQYVRCRKVEHLLDEIKSTVAQYPSRFSNFVGFSNPTLNIDRKWVHEFCRKYAENINLPFGCDVELSNLTDDMVRDLADANCREVWIGFESGNDFIRKDILHKNLRTKDAVAKIDSLRSAGIKVLLFVIIGLPFETEDMMNDTYRVLKDISIDEILPSIYFPLPGTTLGELCYENGWAQRINKNNARPIYGYEYESILKYPHITPEKIGDFYQKIKSLNRKTAQDILSSKKVGGE